jgi:hypothetical protein
MVDGKAKSTATVISGRILSHIGVPICSLPNIMIFKIRRPKQIRREIRPATMQKGTRRGYCAPSAKAEEPIDRSRRKQVSPSPPKRL